MAMVSTVPARKVTVAMPRSNRLRLLFVPLLLLVLGSAIPLEAQGADGDPWADALAQEYSVSTDIVYRTAGGEALTLDIYRPRAADGPQATVICYHGGGWVTGDKNGTMLRFLPFIRMGFTVVTVNYRLAKQAPAPAAVEDARFAFRWVISRAEKYNIDPERIVLTGTSAGAHLALMAGMLPVSEGLDHAPGSDAAQGVTVADWWTTGSLTQPRAAAIIDFWGIADVDDLIQGPNARNWAMDWIGDTTNRALAVRMSPLTWVSADAPPVLMIHGDPDPYVPFEHSTRLKEALDRAGVRNRLVRFPGGGHGDFNGEDMHKAWNEVRKFLREGGIIGE